MLLGILEAHALGTGLCLQRGFFRMTIFQNLTQLWLRKGFDQANDLFCTHDGERITDPSRAANRQLRRPFRREIRAPFQFAAGFKTPGARVFYSPNQRSCASLVRRRSIVLWACQESQASRILALLQFSGRFAVANSAPATTPPRTRRLAPARECRSTHRRYAPARCFRDRWRRRGRRLRRGRRHRRTRARR